MIRLNWLNRSPILRFRLASAGDFCWQEVIQLLEQVDFRRQAAGLDAANVNKIRRVKRAGAQSEVFTSRHSVIVGFRSSCLSFPMKNPTALDEDSHDSRR